MFHPPYFPKTHTWYPLILISHFGSPFSLASNGIVLWYIFSKDYIIKASDTIPLAKKISDLEKFPSSMNLVALVVRK